jgi:hypothetical protein
MNRYAIGALGQAVGSAAVLFSFFYLARQIRQSTEATRVRMVAAAIQQETDFSIAQMGENPGAVIAKAALTPEKLSTGDIHVLLSRVGWYLSMLRRNEMMENSGIFDASWCEQLLPRIAGQIASDPVSRRFLLLQPASSEWMGELQRLVGATSTNLGAGSYGSLLAVAEGSAQTD